jgi:hypothetical protein
MDFWKNTDIAFSSHWDFTSAMTLVVDEKGCLKLPSNFKPGEKVDVQAAGEDALVIAKTTGAGERKVRRVTLPDGYSVIVGLPPIDSEGVKRLLEDFP